jgi:PAS domain S-box-containing protein
MIKEATQISRGNYRLLVENIKEYAIIMLDISGRVIAWNAGAELLKGYKENEIVGKHISVFYKQDEVENNVPGQNLQKALEKGEFEDEGWRVRKDGSVFWASDVITALKDNMGNLVAFGEVCKDITGQRSLDAENKRSNLELENQLQRTQSEISDYKHALDESSIVAITDQKGIIKHVNNNFCKISKYSAPELIGQDHRIINSGHHPKEFIRNLWVTIANGRIWRGELKNKAKDGSFYWVDTTIVPFLSEKGKPYQYLAIRSDITPRKLAEEEILHINENLEKKIKERTYELTEALEREKELNDMKSRFVSIASHEFRTPLSAILSSISLIEHYKVEEQYEKRQKHIERIKSSVHNLTNILNNFLSLDKLEQGKVEAKSTNFDLHELINDIMEEIDGMVKKKRQKITYEIKGETVVYQDKKILHNVLLNLLSNAIKYSLEEKPIHITVVADNGKVSISVKDEGIGIPSEVQKDLFTKFFRANNALNIQGTGLGLNIVEKYVELLEGNIQFSSKENEGSTFRVEFPQYKD